MTTLLSALSGFHWVLGPLSRLLSSYYQLVIYSVTNLNHQKEITQQKQYVMVEYQLLHF